MIPSYVVIYPYRVSFTHRSKHVKIDLTVYAEAGTKPEDIIERGRDQLVDLFEGNITAMQYDVVAPPERIA